MLQTIRDRAQGIFAWIILILITVPFALWGIGNYFDTGKEQPIAVVGKREFFERDLIRLYEQQYARFLEQNHASEQALKQQALDRLINDELMFQAALDRGLVVSDAQVAEFIRGLALFQTDGHFDADKYQRLLAVQGLSPDQFVAQVRRSLLLEQLEQGIVRSGFATNLEAERFYRLQNQRRKIAYLILPLPKRDLTINDEQIGTYYQEHQSQFQTPERVAVDYLALSIQDIAKGIEPEEEELHRYYEEQQEAFATPEQRRIRHILVSVPPDASAEEKQKALTKIRELKQRLEQGEDFAELAKEYSDDPGSKAKGGDLGFVKRGLLEKNFEDVAFALPEGKISDPVETPFGYHLIQVTEIKPGRIQPFGEVKEQIRREVQRQAAENRFYELGEKLAQLAYENPASLEPAADALGLKISSTSRFTRDQGQGIAANPKIRAAAFSADVLAGNNSEPIEIDEGTIVVLRVREHIPAEQRPLDAVRAEISALLSKQQARLKAEAEAKSWLTQLRQGSRLEEIARKIKADVTVTELVRANASPELREVTGAVFQAPRPTEGKPIFLRTPMSDGRQMLIQILAVEDGDYASLKPEEKNNLKANLARLLGLMTFKEYREQLRNKAKVKINWTPAETE